MGGEVVYAVCTNTREKGEGKYKYNNVSKKVRIRVTGPHTLRTDTLSS